MFDFPTTTSFSYWFSCLALFLSCFTAICYGLRLEDRHGLLVLLRCIFWNLNIQKNKENWGLTQKVKEMFHKLLEKLKQIQKFLELFTQMYMIEESKILQNVIGRYRRCQRLLEYSRQVWSNIKKSKRIQKCIEGFRKLLEGFRELLPTINAFNLYCPFEEVKYINRLNGHL